MATIDLNSIIRPKQANYKTVLPSKVISAPLPVYTDIHLDIKKSQSIGVGNNPSATINDILVDNDLQAIKNSLNNIFTTKKGDKILNPNFGCSLEQFLFEPATEIGAKAIGDTINNAITLYEPRVTVIKIFVQPNPQSTINLFNLANTSGKVVENNSNGYGPGYGITVVYKINEINKQDTMSLVAKIGGQIIYQH